MLDLMTLQQMREVDINTIDPSTVTDAKDINIDINLPVQERMTQYVQQIGNPYFIKVGKVVIKMNFPDTELSVNDCFEQYLKIC
jgi:hypothetical protein